jgi:FkbM family methyltransferase
VKRFIKRVINASGYEIQRRVVDPHPERRDPFLQQRALLGCVTAPLIFDVGANIGSVTCEYRRLIPNATIYAFEPFPESFRRLQAMFASDRLVHPHQLGFAERASTLPFNVNSDPVTNSLLMTDVAGSSFWGKNILDTIQEIEVEIATVDAFCQTNDIKHIDILKIDTQGAEARVLQGSERMLGDKRISCIYAEILLVPTYQGQGKFREILALLDNHSYSLFSIYNCEYRPGSNRLLQVDAIFTL